VDLDDVGVETVDLWPRHAASAFRSCSDRDVPFWLALFASNVGCVVLPNWLVPWASRGFGWWLVPRIRRS
jgi:hypothetical protein